MKIGIIIQARMGSSRLPGKVLKKIKGRSILEYVVARAKKINNIDEIIVATTENPEDDEIVKICKLKGISFFRGSENDVLSRYFDCAKKFKLDHIVRLTSDNPLIDIIELNRLVNMHLISLCDYSESMTNLPVGIGSEIFSFYALEQSFLFGTLPHHREHVNEYVLENKSKFNTMTLEASITKNIIDRKLSIDTIEDFNYVSKIFHMGKNDLISLDEVIKICSRFV